MGLFTPETGLIFWMLIVFLTVVGILGKFAWPFITKAIAEREKYISNSVQAAIRPTRSWKASRRNGPSSWLKPAKSRMPS